ncbi:hypothetical protein SAMN06264364_11260 [Quadrisphaera granulorum]|uniref:TetR family transcriptional regulator n=1 Tax=Quadrisphaera granulorum TaxID=317664 RepID=A0A316A921_9ACTN|nr:hypothetical protein [Quadrisphaera granulorum]PWJ53490.1 hypothetical protein BXY45_11260 [Quadrisphaera granulorum]SZE96832.1 hypothetical protein SAMN06264364_11260 [Quadrisphaera granulorum]
MRRLREDRPRLSRELIVATGLDLARANEEPTLGAVSRRIGVHISSLYDHVTDRADLVNAMRAATASEMTDASLPSEWEALLRLLAVSMGRVFATYPGAIVSFAMTPLPESSESPVDHAFDALVAAMEADGIPAQRAEAGVRALNALMLGLALDSLDPDTDPTGTETARQVGVDGLIAALRAYETPDVGSDHRTPPR